MRFRLTRVLLLVLAAAPLGAGTALGLTLDWNTSPWPGTSTLTATYTVGGGDVTLTVTDPAGVIDGTTSEGTPGSLATNGALNPPSAGANNLFIKTDANTASNTGGDFVTVDIVFTHAGGVADVAFSLFDVDQHLTSGFTDQIYLEASDGINTYAPSSVTALAADQSWSFDGSNTITGTSNAGTNSERGTSAIVFNQTVTRVTFQYRNTLDPGQVQFIGLSSIIFRQAPEPSTGLLLGFGLTLLAARRRGPRSGARR